MMQDHVIGEATSCNKQTYGRSCDNEPLFGKRPRIDQELWFRVGAHCVIVEGTVVAKCNPPFSNGYQQHFICPDSPIRVQIRVFEFNSEEGFVQLLGYKMISCACQRNIWNPFRFYIQNIPLQVAMGNLIGSPWCS